LFPIQKPIAIAGKFGELRFVDQIGDSGGGLNPCRGYDARDRGVNRESGIGEFYETKNLKKRQQDKVKHSKRLSRRRLMNMQKL
jgi:hypothetical protein